MLNLPSQMLVEARLAGHSLADPVGETRARLGALLAGGAWKGRRVAVAAGSRGIDRYASVVRAVVEALKAEGALPFVMPAMGSHGGATGPGQAEVLEALGITEETVGAPVCSTIDTVELGRTALDFPVLCAKDAVTADAIVLVNRVKPHTDFASPDLGSGMLKMTAIGLGKVDGAFECHRAASRHGHAAVIREASRVAIERLPLLLGVALVEDSHHHLARVEAMAAHEFAAREPELLKQARDWMPSIPFPEIDVLILDEIGKNISGAGMDTNIVGRGVNGLPREDRKTTARCLYVRSLTPESHGNAVGVGLADVVSSSLLAGMDEHSTYMNALSAMTPAMVRKPMHFDSDAECLKAALRIAGVSAETARIVRLRNTLALDRLVVSSAFGPALRERDDLRVVVSARDWPFTSAGNLDPSGDLLATGSAA